MAGTVDQPELETSDAGLEVDHHEQEQICKFITQMEQTNKQLEDHLRAGTRYVRLLVEKFESLTRRQALD